MKTDRRNFVKTASIGAAGLVLGGQHLSAKSYKRIMGANDRIRVCIMGMGGRSGAYVSALTDKKNNTELAYVCDVMDAQLVKAKKTYGGKLDYPIKLEKDYRKLFDDKEVNAVFIATPDHWHTPASIYAMQAGQHVYVEKPCSHNMAENEMIVEAMRKYNRVVQMGNQQRSSGHTQEIIREIHNGAIGTPYKAVAFYSNGRNRVPNQKIVPVPEGLDWELFQGPAPRREYTSETWDYNWHWYGWDYGTAELGNNATHELDIARWALQVAYPNHVEADGKKTAFLDDGWEMYDEMYTTFKFDGGLTINWDGKSRNGLNTYGAGRGTIIYGSEGSVWVDRSKYTLYDRGGKVIRDSISNVEEGGLALGGGGGMTTDHMINFFNTIRGTGKLTAPIDDAAISMAMVHYGNVAYRIGSGFDIDTKTGKMLNSKAMKLWKREFAKGWELKV